MVTEVKPMVQHSDVFGPDPVAVAPPASKPGVFGRLLKSVGIGLGDMQLSINGPYFHYGDTISGRVVYSLNSPTQIKRLVAGVLATQKVYRPGVDAQGKPMRVRDVRTVYRFEVELGGGQETTGGDVSFEMHLPPPPPDPQLPQNLLGDLARVGSFLMTLDSPVTWVVYSKLEIPWNVGLRRQVDISVGN
jgi:hypothetical protein